jgi:ADP-heptose:LPS heptosyltransferase
MESLRSDYTEVWCAGQNLSLARFADRAQSIVSAGLDRLGFLPAEDMIERLRGFDSIVSWYGANRPEFRELTKELRLPFTFFHALPDGTCHAVDFYNRQAISLGAAAPSRFPEIACPPVERDCAIIHPFASSPAKRAPIGAFERIAEELASRMPVHWLCGPEESLPCAIRIDDLYELARRLSAARIFVGNDSGISHLAAAVRTPCFTIFQVTDPAVWAPRGPAVWITRSVPSAPAVPEA